MTIPVTPVCGNAELFNTRLGMSGGCEMISHCGFKWISRSTNELGFLECLWAILVSCMKCLFIFFVYVPSLWVVFLSYGVLIFWIWIFCSLPFFTLWCLEELKFLFLRKSNLQYIPLWFILWRILNNAIFYPKVIKIYFYIVF